MSDLHIVVGSTNPVKVGAVELGLRSFFQTATFEAVEVFSKVSSQPMSNSETSRGAYERAVGALEKKNRADIAIGLEGGVFINNGRVWNTVWCCAVDRQHPAQLVNGLRFLLPEVIGRQLLHGKEMGPVMDELTGISDVKKKSGMLGIVTGGMISRQDGYAHLVQLAVGRLLSDWQ